MVQNNIFKTRFVGFIAIVLIFFATDQFYLYGFSPQSSTFEEQVKNNEASLGSTIDQKTEVNPTTSGEPDQKTYFLEFFPLYQVEIRVLLVVILILLTGIVLLFLFIFLNRVRKTRIREKEQLMRIIYQEQLTNYIYGDDSQNYEFTGINRLSNRQIFIDEMLWLHRNLYGETAKRLQDLYFNLNLYGDSLKKLSSSFWAVKASGFRELAQMEVSDVAPEIMEYVNSKNTILRMEAQLALVNLKPDDPLGFLDNLKLHLTEWEQINILNTLLHNEVKIDSFERWMSSKNESVVIFSLNLARFFNHTHSLTKVSKLVYHENSSVRLAAIKALGSFEFPENTALFMDSYLNHLPVENTGNDVFYNLKMSGNRLAAIEALEVISTETDIPFFEFVLRNEKEFDIFRKALNVLYTLQKDNLSVIDEVYEQAEPKIRRIIDQKKVAQI
ncbi:MAG TPA: HEAT repeat domain-containing protein [Bacteroidales bacterium]|nr:HEAT repeat domain-containing protein [Bacteroidales bacterium]